MPLSGGQAEIGARHVAVDDELDPGAGGPDLLGEAAACRGRSRRRR
jgi:hypothetical protein